MTTQTPTPQTEVLRLKQAASYLGVSIATLWRLEQNDSEFPSKVRFSARCVGFRKPDLDDYLIKKMGGA